MSVKTEERFTIFFLIKEKSSKSLTDGVTLHFQKALCKRFCILK